MTFNCLNWLSCHLDDIDSTVILMAVHDRDDNDGEGPYSEEIEIARFSGKSHVVAVLADVERLVNDTYKPGIYEFRLVDIKTRDIYTFKC